MITRQEYEKSKQIVAEYELQIKKQNKKIEFENYIKAKKPEVIDIIEEIKKIGFSTWSDERVRKYDDDLDYISYIQNNLVLEVFFNEERILIDLWINNVANEIGADGIYTVDDLNSTIEILKEEIDRINRQWQKLQPLMKKYNIKKFVKEEF